MHTALHSNVIENLMHLYTFQNAYTAAALHPHLSSSLVKQ